jgi:hypothetical protein
MSEIQIAIAIAIDLDSDGDADGDHCNRIPPCNGGHRPPSTGNDVASVSAATRGFPKIITHANES